MGGSEGGRVGGGGGREKCKGVSVLHNSYTAKNYWARFDTDCRKVSNRGQGGARIEHVRPLRPRTDTGVTCRFEL